MDCDYAVNTRVTFHLSYDSQEINALMLPTLQRQFSEHVRAVFERDDTLGAGYVEGDLNFHFQGTRTAYLDYVFECNDESKSEAESFSRYCVTCVKSQLEAFGCQIKRIDCTAEEKDFSWFDRLEDAVFGPKTSAPDKKKGSRQER